MTHIHSYTVGGEFSNWKLQLSTTCSFAWWFGRRTTAYTIRPANVIRTERMLHMALQTRLMPLRTPGLEVRPASCIIPVAHFYFTHGITTPNLLTASSQAATTSSCLMFLSSARYSNLISSKWIASCLAVLFTSTLGKSCSGT
jgi:hypothetical protein